MKANKQHSFVPTENAVVHSTAESGTGSAVYVPSPERAVNCNVVGALIRFRAVVFMRQFGWNHGVLSSSRFRGGVLFFAILFILYVRRNHND